MSNVEKLREPKLTFEHQYAPHDLANLLPMIDAARFAELREDIRKNGILEPSNYSRGAFSTDAIAIKPPRK